MRQARHLLAMFSVSLAAAGCGQGVITSFASTADEDGGSTTDDPDGPTGNRPDGATGNPPDGATGNQPDGSTTNPPDGPPGNRPDGSTTNPPDGGTSNPPDAGVPGQPDGGGPGPGPLNLCAGLVTDKQARPMTALAKPALGQTVTDAEFGTTIRRITAVPATGSNPAYRPMYSTISAWNADESRMILYRVGGGHQLFDGKSYAFIRALDISPADIEQVYWHTFDPDILFYVDGRNFIRYHVGSGTKETLTTFDFCSGDASGGDDPMFMSFDSARIGLQCGGQLFVYDIAANTVLGRKTLSGTAQITSSGALVMNTDNADIMDLQLNVLRRIDNSEPNTHASMGILPNGEDTWNAVVFDEGPMGNDDIGTLVVWNLTRNTSKVVIGQKTGWPYPKTTHLSGLAYKQPGWVFVTSLGDTSGQGLLDLELLVANTVDNTVCRVGRHRSWGKENTNLADPYWAEGHAVASPSGTRAVFASDWGNGETVDAYVLELPSYQP